MALPKVGDIVWWEWQENSKGVFVTCASLVKVKGDKCKLQAETVKGEMKNPWAHRSDLWIWRTNTNGTS